MAKYRWLERVVFLWVATVLACEEPPAPMEESIRPVKTVVVNAHAMGSARTFSGTIVAADVSALSFRVPGTLQTVDVDLGQSVRRGQVLARLDDTPYRLRVQQARADVKNAQAILAEARDRRARIQALFEAGAASRADLDRVVADDDAAASSLVGARAALDLARRDNRDTVLEAPFDGRVAEKRVDAFEEVTAGQTVFVLHTSGAAELELLLPDSLIDDVKVGDPVSVEVSNRSAGVEHYSGRVREIGSAAVETNAFPVTVAVDSDDSRLRPGRAAEATFTFRNGDGESWLIPINAFVPAPGSDQSVPLSERELTVFVVDPVAETVSRRAVVPLGIRGNDVLVSEGLVEGEHVVVAGVSFLHDGQKVRLVESER